MKPELTVTLKIRGVVIDGMTAQELHELRDVLNEVLGDRVIERRDYVPYYSSPTIAWGGTGDVPPTETVITCSDVWTVVNGASLGAASSSGLQWFFTATG